MRECKTWHRRSVEDPQLGCIFREHRRTGRPPNRLDHGQPTYRVRRRLLASARVIRAAARA